MSNQKTYREHTYKFTGSKIERTSMREEKLSIGDSLVLNGEKRVRGAFNTTNNEAVKVIAGIVCEIKNLKKGKKMRAVKIFRQVKNLILQDANAGELEFPEVEITDRPAVGDKIHIDGKTKETGKRVMPDGSTIEFKEGIITKIIKSDVNSLKKIKEDVESLKAYYKSIEEEPRVKRVI